MDKAVESSLKAPRLVFYGASKIGISSFLSNIKGALFLDTDDSLSYLKVNKFTPKTYEDLVKKIKELALLPVLEEAGDVQPKAFIVDHLLGLERLIFDHVCKVYEEGKFRSIDDFPYGKGYIYYVLELIKFFKYLNYLRNKKNMTIILAAHSVLDEVTTPLGDKYNYYKPYLIGKTHKGEDPVEILTQWCDGLFYVGNRSITSGSLFMSKNYQDIVSSTNYGSPLIYTNNTALFKAGNRLGLETELPLDWNEFMISLEKRNELMNGNYHE